MMSKCRITVLRRSLDRELIDRFAAPQGREWEPCEQFSEGQAFVVEQPFRCPEGFCTWAWADIRHAILRVACGGAMPFYREKDMEVGGCTDWLRPVLFKIERLEDDPLR